MKFKTVEKLHKKQVPHPHSYMGVTEGKGHKTSIVIEFDKSHPITIEDLMMLLGTMTRTSWHLVNDIRADLKMDKINLHTFVTMLYNVTRKFTTDGELKHE